MLLPLQGVGCAPYLPRAMPRAGSFLPLQGVGCAPYLPRGDAPGWELFAPAGRWLRTVFTQGDAPGWELSGLSCVPSVATKGRAQAVFVKLEKQAHGFLITFPPMAYCWETLKFSREFGGLLVANVGFVGSKAPNSLENSEAANAESSSCTVTIFGLGGSKSTCFYPFCRCARQHLSPSCHPCHPQKRVQMPCTSAFCHPDTLRRKILSI